MWSVGLAELSVPGGHQTEKRDQMVCQPRVVCGDEQQLLPEQHPGDAVGQHICLQQLQQVVAVDGRQAEERREVRAHREVCIHDVLRGVVHEERPVVLVLLVCLVVFERRGEQVRVEVLLHVRQVQRGVLSDGRVSDVSLDLLEQLVSASRRPHRSLSSRLYSALLLTSFFMLAAMLSMLGSVGLMPRLTGVTTKEW